MHRTLYLEHESLEDSHWWFKARRRIVLGLLRRRVRLSGARLLDVGCGTGGTLAALRALNCELHGLEPDEQAARAARRKTAVEIHEGALPDASCLANQTFDIVTALDVIEHIEKDRAALTRVNQLLRPGGVLLCTVPAFKFLWSKHDERNQHFRRYTRSSLIRALEAAGFRIEMASYFNAFLFPFIALARLIPWSSGENASDFRKHSAAINRLLESVFALERFLLPYLRLPFGVSLIALATKAEVQS